MNTNIKNIIKNIPNKKSYFNGVVPCIVRAFPVNAV
jgi:hypothetical protein